MGKKQKIVDYIVIDQARFVDTVDAYFQWKELNSFIKRSHSRITNFPEIISESLLCHVMGYRLIRGNYADAIDEDGNLIEVKATSNWERDTSSFGPVTSFDKLFFARLNQSKDLLVFYDLGLTGETIKQIKVNKNETVGDQQKQKRRPRFSIIKNIIKKRDLKPVAEINLRTQKITKY